MYNLLQPGMKIGNDELVLCLSSHNKLIPSWKAIGTDGKAYVLRFLLPYHYGIADVPQKDLEPLKALPPIRGFLPWSEWDIVQLDAKKTVLVTRRPYYPQTLTDRFPPNAANPPSKALLEAFQQLAQTFDTLQSHLPNFNFDLAPGNLLLDGDLPLLVDCGLNQHEIYHDWNTRSPISNYVEHERGVPLSANYPSQWGMWSATGSAYKDKIHRTDAQYALAAMYIYLRTRFLVFEEPNYPFPQIKSGSPQEKLLAKLSWQMKLSETVQKYEEAGTLKLPMLLDEHEKTIVARALSRDEAARYATCAAFIEALQSV